MKTILFLYKILLVSNISKAFGQRGSRQQPLCLDCLTLSFADDSLKRFPTLIRTHPVPDLQYSAELVQPRKGLFFLLWSSVKSSQIWAVLNISYLHPTPNSKSCKVPKPSKGQMCCSDNGADAQLLEGNNDTRPRGTEAHCRVQQICQKASMAAGTVTLRKFPRKLLPCIFDGAHLWRACFF